MAPRSSNKQLASATFDVVRNFVEYGQYQRDETLALRALSRRAPGFSAKTYQTWFRFQRELLEATIKAFRTTPLLPAPRAGAQRFASAEDVDAGAILHKLRAAFPARKDAELATFIPWVVFWHYLR
ncbi:MAG: hypothetical protein IT375_27065 [Polyangiaceae bacterium]|nr:hypothetical protein [Polyangiaceae bacterium]